MNVMFYHRGCPTEVIAVTAHRSELAQVGWDGVLRLTHGSS